ncbi:hypothetical protein CBS76997_5353 [Aspergillus niger]|nr:hypothetical protein CBS13152_8282 [Aspergillus niger]KAI3044136.1 hypothetical protein CBS76997_5353 [Aspergillus niger]
MNIIHHQNHLSITTALSHLTTPTPSYSVRRIRAEYLAATKNGPTSPQCDFLSFRPFSPDHLFDIIGTIAGPVGSPYEGGIFHIHIRIPALYPDLPPICTFMTKIWHPNVGPYGEVCLNILQDEWSQALSVRTVLLSISAMLGDPGMAVEGGNAEKAATEGGLTPDGRPLLHPSPQAYYWAFDIYEQEKMESDLLATLKGNRDDPNKSDSDGYVLISILDDLAAKTENERQQLLKAGNFGPWFQSTYGLNRSQGPRVLTNTTAPFWRDLWRSYVMTPYGEKYFNFTTAEDIASTKLEKLWAREIDFVLTFGDRIFEGKKVTSADWETVLAAMEKGPRADFLRRLFFPTKADHEDGSLTGLLLLNQKWFNQWTLPRLAGDTFTTSSKVNTRRPGFLAKLSDVEYHKVFINMQQNPGLTCPRWGDFHFDAQVWWGLKEEVGAVVLPPGQKEWEVARAELIEYSMTLNRRGIMVNADQLNESLERLALPTHANPVAEDGEPIMGFLEMDPESYGLEQQGNTERLQELLVRTLDEEIDSL